MIRREECRIDPLTAADLDQVLAWRNSERIRANMYTDHVISWGEHRTWFASVAQQRPSRFLVYRMAGRPLGVVNFSEPDPVTGVCYWGFYLGEEDAPPGSGSVMALLALEYAFATLKASAVIGEAFRFNDASIAYHKRLGFEEQGSRSVPKGGREEEVAGFLLTRASWETQRGQLDAQCFAAGEGA